MGIIDSPSRRYRSGSQLLNRRSPIVKKSLLRNLGNAFLETTKKTAYMTFLPLIKTSEILMLPFKNYRPDYFSHHKSLSTSNNLRICNFSDNQPNIYQASKQLLTQGNSLYEEGQTLLAEIDSYLSNEQDVSANIASLYHEEESTNKETSVYGSDSEKWASDSQYEDFTNQQGELDDFYPRYPEVLPTKSDCQNNEYFQTEQSSDVTSSLVEDLHQPNGNQLDQIIDHQEVISHSISNEPCSQENFQDEGSNENQLIKIVESQEKRKKKKKKSLPSLPKSSKKKSSPSSIEPEKYTKQYEEKMLDPVQLHTIYEQDGSSVSHSNLIPFQNENSENHLTIQSSPALTVMMRRRNRKSTPLDQKIQVNLPPSKKKEQRVSTSGIKAINLKNKNDKENHNLQKSRQDNSSDFQSSFQKVLTAKFYNARGGDEASSDSESEMSNATPVKPYFNSIHSKTTQSFSKKRNCS